MTKLKPCPYCGESAKVRWFKDDDRLAWQVCCSDIGCLVRPITPSYRPKEAAVDAWNTRAKEDQINE